MRPDLPWNVAGVPPEAREAARAAARREGLSVGEWLTRKILRSLVETDLAEDDRDHASSDNWTESSADRPSPRNETGEQMASAPLRAFDAESACSGMENELRSLARRIEATERGQRESHRGVSKAIGEVTVVGREQKRAIDEVASSVTNLSHRLERVERQAPSEGLREAVRGLHQGLTRLADQVSQATGHSADQVAALAEKLEGIADRLGQTTLETDSIARRLEGRTAQIDEHMRAIERRIEANASDATRAAE